MDKVKKNNFTQNGVYLVGNGKPPSRLGGHYFPYSECSGFESWSSYRVVDLLSTSLNILGVYLEIGPVRFHPQLSPFILHNHLPIWRYITYAIETTSLNAINIDIY
jgi:hypothetical protein